MTTTMHTWEQPLLALAHDAWHSLTHTTAVHGVRDNAVLDEAYRYCESITAEHSRSFHLASSLLPSEKRRAVRALYAFCRITDDIVDQPDQDAESTLAQWRYRLDHAADETDLVALAWTDTRMRYRIPRKYGDQLIDGVARDLRQQRYASFDDLATYCYGVASTVGLMSMHIVGFSGPEAIPYAIKLGVALQMTNILRDVAADLASDRVYLPSSELIEYDIKRSDLDEGRVTDRWRRFMKFQIARNRQLYEESWPGIALLDPDGRLAIAAAANLYRGILDDIEAHDYDVFSRRAHVSKLGKLRRLPGIWWSARTLRFDGIDA
ncbi:MAG: squalene/phytoene synthase family protein [Caldilineales bacterium]|nr:squalene/phytoene synthase family protein [Caldilineales bacterium]